MSKGNFEYDLGSGDQSCDNWELNIRLITVRPEGSFQRICFDHLICIPSHRGLQFCLTLQGQIVIWYNNVIMVPQVERLMAVLRLCDVSSAVLPGDASLLICFLPQLGFKLFLSSCTSTVLPLILWHCLSEQASSELIPAMHNSKALKLGPFTWFWWASLGFSCFEDLLDKKPNPFSFCGYSLQMSLRDGETKLYLL